MKNEDKYFHLHQKAIRELVEKGHSEEEAEKLLFKSDLKQAGFYFVGLCLISLSIQYLISIFGI